MKRTQITSENIDELYKKVNELIDSYFEWKVKASSLKRYLKKGSIGMKKFIERNELGNIDRIDKIILDVVDDRNGMEKDGVVTFENFTSTFTEEEPKEKHGHDSILYDGIEKSDIEFEKIIADKYRTSLGHIESTSEDKHTYEIHEKNNFFEVIVFSEEDLLTIEKNLNEFVYDHLYQSEIKMQTINLNIKISDLISNKEDLKSKLKLSDDVLDVVSEILGNNDYQYDTDFKGYHIWSR